VGKRRPGLSLRCGHHQGHGLSRKIYGVLGQERFIGDQGSYLIASRNIGGGQHGPDTV
jgi:hypothetical protein